MVNLSDIISEAERILFAAAGVGIRTRKHLRRSLLSWESFYDERILQAPILHPIIMLRHIAFFTFAVVAAATNSTASIIDLSNSTFNRTKCSTRIEQLWTDGARNVTFDGITYLLGGTQYEPIIAPALCPILCGGRSAWYGDSSARIFVWLAPILFMIFNLQFQDLGYRRYLEVVVLLGNPIGFFLALFSELEVWRESTQLAETLQNESGRSELLYRTDVLRLARLIAIHQRHSDNGDILHEFSRVQTFWKSVIQGTVVARSSNSVTKSYKAPHRALSHEVAEFSDLTCEQMEVDSSDVGTMTTSFPVHELIHQFDRSMSMCRKNELAKVLLAGLIFCVGTIAPYFPELSNGDAPSGTKVGPSLLLTFILFGIAFNNAIGDYPRRHARCALDCFFKRHSCRLPSCENCVPRGLASEESTREELLVSFEERSMCVYRPRIPLNRNNIKWRRVVPLIMSCLAVAAPFITATFVLATAPMNFKFRNKLASGVFGSWVISVLFDWTLSWLEIVTSERLFWVCMIKNIVIGIYTATMTIFIASGLGNDCGSWLDSGGEVVINPLREFEMNAKVRYPVTVGVALSVELAILVIIYLMNRQTFRTIWR